jgi:GNAT superfamily N-acetyltransferase
VRMGSVSIRSVHAAADPAIPGFGRLQRYVYYAPEALIPVEMVPSLLAEHGPGRHNLLLVAEVDSRVVGGTLLHAFPGPGTGFVSFLGVARDCRRQGVARRLHAACFAEVDRACGRPVVGLFADAVNPGRLPPYDLAREAAVGSDPRARRRALAQLGYRQVDVDYQQPVDGADGGPVTNLDLLYCPREATDTIATALVPATLCSYWAPGLGDDVAERHAQALAGACLPPSDAGADAL